MFKQADDFDKEDETRLGRIKNKIRQNIVSYGIAVIICCIAVVACVSISMYIGKDDGDAPSQAVVKNEPESNSGESGGLKWSFSFDKVLTISGDGEMDSYKNPGDAEWKNYLDKAEKIVIEDGVKSIGANAFNGFKVHEVVIGKDVAVIEELAFANCVNLPEISLPEGLEAIEEKAFYSCSYLKEAKISDNTENIAEDAFDRCHAEFRITAPEGSVAASFAANYLGEHSELADAEYEDDNRLDSGSCGEDCMWYLYPDYSLVISGDGGMYNFENVGSVPWDDYKEKITSVKIHQGVTNVGQNAFANCGALKKAEISEGVTSIGVEAFANCGELEEVHIPTSVRAIEDDAFMGRSRGMKIHGDPRSYAGLYALINFIGFRIE